MSCEKKAFKTDAQGRKALREWRRLARRSNFDRAHVYLADCAEPTHRGKFHIGLIHDSVNRHVKTTPRAYDRTRAQIIDSLDDPFARHTQRIVGSLSRAERRRQARLTAEVGEDFDVEEKK